MNSEEDNKIEILDESIPVKNDSNVVLNNSNIIEDNTVKVEDKVDNRVEIKESATIKSEVGTSVIGNINGDNITATNDPLPEKININVKAKGPAKVNNKKIRVVTKREKIMNVIVVILVILILGGGGFATYYFAYLNNPSIFTVKDLSFELGDELPTSITYYVTSPKTVDGMEYSLDLSNVEAGVGSYSYTVTHKSVQKSGNITIKDTKGPVVTFKDNLSFSKGSILTKDDIVKSCDDPSNCTYKLENDIDTSVSGKKDLNIIANDDIGNISTSSVSINIIDISKFITCTSAEETSSDKTYKTVAEDTINFDSSDNLVSSSSKKVVTYIDLNAFFTLYNAEKDNTEYSFDKVKFNYTIKNDIDLNGLKTYTEIVNSYNQRGYSCK